MSTYLEIAQEIVEDMTGRAGGDWWWDSLDEEIKQEILQEWAGIIREGVFAP